MLMGLPPSRELTQEDKRAIYGSKARRPQRVRQRKKRRTPQEIGQDIDVWVLMALPIGIAVDAMIRGGWHW